jgi:dTDP-glucose 4,6-dehydratase
MVRAWSGRRVLVTGAGGFIGSHLVEALVRQGASVRAFVRYTSRSDAGLLARCAPEVLSELDVFRGDLVNPDAVDAATDGQDTVLHLGALIPIPYSYRHPREFVAANVEGTLNVLQSARGHDVERLVHTSTSEVYGTARTVPIDEEHPLHPQSPYAATKVGADQLALSFQRSFALPVVVARPFNTFGPRQSARAVIPTIITQALVNERVKLGSTSPTRDFVYVEDTVRGVMRCGLAEGVEGEVFNLGTGVEVSIGEIIERVSALLGQELAVDLDEDRLRPQDSEVERLLADASKAKARLGWVPEVEFDEGLRRTIEEVRSSLDSYDASVYNV